MHPMLHDTLARTIQAERVAAARHAPQRPPRRGRGARHRLAVAAAVVTTAFLVTSVAAFAAEPGEMIVLDQPSGFGDALRGAGNYSTSSAGVVSADGRYRLTLAARDAAGRRSAPVRLRFRIVRP